MKIKGKQRASAEECVPLDISLGAKMRQQGKNEITEGQEYFQVSWNNKTEKIQK